MPRLLALAASAAFLAGCSGGAATQPALNTIGTLAHQSRLLASPTNCPASPSGSGILDDGDFHLAPYPGYFQTFSYEQMFAPGWEVTENTIDLNGTVFQTPGGLCSIDLDGNQAIGAIQHNAFHTRSGATHTVGFLLSGNGYAAPTVKTMVVGADGQFQQFTWDTSNGNDAQHGKYTPQTWRFTGAGRASKLTFASLDPSGSCCGAVVAAISVTKN